MVRQNLILDNNFDAGALTGFTLANGQFCCNYSLAIAASPDGIGKAVRYELRRTDKQVSSSIRSEMQLSVADLAGGSMGSAGDAWYGLKYWFDTYDTDKGAESILQWHDNNGPCPPQSIQIQSGRFRWQQCQPVPAGSTSGSANTSTDMGPVELHKWVSFVIHIKFSTTANGVIEVWKDGVKVVNKTGLVTNSPSGSYLKIGINKWSWDVGSPNTNITTPRIFYIDEFRAGSANATYNDVAPDVVTTVPNIPPTVDAGATQSLELASAQVSGEVSLNGTALDTDGSVTSLKWAQVTGPNTAVMANDTTSHPTISSLIPGNYLFRLTATDNSGDSSFSTTNVNVTRVANILPSVTVGPNRLVTLPTDNIDVTATALDPDGSIVNVAWEKLSGPTGGAISSPLTLSTNISGLTVGTYKYKVTVTDNRGGLGTATLDVSVLPALVSDVEVARTSFAFTTAQGVRYQVSVDDKDFVDVNSLKIRVIETK